jgi:putative hydrolases of HD superfamily
MPEMSLPNRLQQQLAFLIEADKLKSILRQTSPIGCDETRRENSGEHSWYFALMAFTLVEYAEEEKPIDIFKVCQMALIHDIVEIDAGDSFVYDTVAMLDKAEREQKAADRIFGLLPTDQATHYRALWDEFEAQITPEARYAAAIDRLCGMFPNHYNNGGTWKRHGISAARVIERNQIIADSTPELWKMAEQWVAQAVANGWISEE